MTHFCEENILTHFCEENIQMRIYIENAHVFSHYWRRREPPVSLRCGHSRCSCFLIRSCFYHAKMFIFFMMFFSFDTLLRRKYFDTLLRIKYSDADLHRKCTCFFLTIGDDGSRQSRSVAAILAAVLRIICFELYPHHGEEILKKKTRMQR